MSDAALAMLLEDLRISAETVANPAAFRQALVAVARAGRTGADAVDEPLHLFLPELREPVLLG